MEFGFQFGIALIAALLVLFGIRRILRAMSPEMPGAATEPESEVPAPLKPRKPQLSGAVAVEEPEDDDDDICV